MRLVLRGVGKKTSMAELFRKIGALAGTRVEDQAMKSAGIVNDYQSPFCVGPKAGDRKLRVCNLLMPLQFIPIVLSGPYLASGKVTIHIVAAQFGQITAVVNNATGQ